MAVPVWSGPQISGGGGGTAGSGDVATDTIFDAAGDLVQGSGANTSEKLAKGAEGTIVRAGATKNAYSTSTFADTYTKGAIPYAATANAISGLAHPAATNYVMVTTGADTIGWLQSSADMISLLGSADYATARTNLGTWGVSGSITDEQLVCGETTGGTNLLKSCGAKTTINAGNSTLLCKDSSGEVEACGGVTVSGTTSPVININPQEVDGHTTSTDLTAAQVSNTIIHNYDQAASDVFLILPTAAAGYSFLLTVVTAQANHFCVEAGANDKIYLIAAAGTIAAGDDGAAVCFVAAQAHQQAACWTSKTDATTFDWNCKAIAIGTSTFEAHASSE